MTRSAYPMPVERIAAEVRAGMAAGEPLPSRNRIMQTFRVGAPKAAQVLEIVTAHPAEPTGSTPDLGGSGTVLGPDTAVPDRDGHDAVGDGQPTVELGSADGGADPVPDAGDELANGNGFTQDTNPGHPGLTTVSTDSPADGQPGTDAAPPTAEGEPDSARSRARVRLPRHWPLLLLAAPAFVAIWGGWVGLGRMAGFGEITLLPGIADGFTLDSSITLPIGVEAYAAYALRVWLAGGHGPRARHFAKWSAIGSLVLGMAGQVAYHLMAAAQMTAAPWQITTLVACLPVIVLGCGAALAHLTSSEDTGAGHDRH